MRLFTYIDEKVVYTTNVRMVWVKTDFSENKYPITFLEFHILFLNSYKPLEGICFFFFKNCALDLCAEDRLTRLIRTRNICGISTPCQILSLYSRQQF